MTTCEVRLWGSKIGAVSVEDDSPFAYFRYDPTFLKSGIQLSPLMLPLSENVYTFPNLPLESFHGLPGLLADSLPDKFGNAVIDAWLASLGRTPESFNVVERLCYTGTRGMGALEFYPIKSKDLSKEEIIHVDQLVSLANDVLAKRKTFSVPQKGSFHQLLAVGSSAGGARAKAVVAYHEKTHEFRSGQIEAGKDFTYWIIKFDGMSNNADKDADTITPFTRIEYAYYLMAVTAGITMSESFLFQEEKRYHFMTKRFDRITTSGGQTEKIHMQTLACLSHRDFNTPGSISYEEAVQLMGRLGLSQKDNEQFYRRMVFNVMARNQDDHPKNIAFLMDRQGVWSLSPAYDMTFAYNPNGLWTSSHQMAIHGKRRDLTLEDLLLSGVAMSIKRRVAQKIIDEVTQSLMQWNDFAKKAHLDEPTAAFIQSQFLFLK